MNTDRTQEEADGERFSLSLLRPGERRKKRVVKNGLPTNELVLSASLNGNDRAFPEILQLYVRPGSVVADVTYGRGVFWRHVPAKMYNVKATDIQDGVDCRNLPYKNGEIDCVVFDPPYMHSPGGTAHVSTRSRRRACSAPVRRLRDRWPKGTGTGLGRAGCPGPRWVAEGGGGDCHQSD